MRVPTFSIISGFAYLSSLIIFLYISGCSSSSSSSGVVTRTASLGTSVKNAQLTNGMQKEIKFTFTIPGDMSAKGDPSIDLTETLKSLTLSSSPITKNTNSFETLRLLAYVLVKDALAATPSTAQITAYVSFPGDPNVCSSSYRLGPYSITGMVDSALSSNTSSIPLTEPIIDITNAGVFEICVVTTPQIDAFVSVSDVVVDFEPCAPSTVDIVGNWAGTFQCTNFGTGNDPVTAISLDISLNPDGSYHYMDDDGAEYDGHLCANKFKFNGSLTGFYTESGTLLFNSSTAATKSSVWNSIPAGIMGGRCTDTLQKT